MGWPALVLIAFILLLLAAVAVLALRPSGLAQIASHPRPSASYDEAMQRVAALQAQEREGYNPSCVTQLLKPAASAGRSRKTW